MRPSACSAPSEVLALVGVRSWEALLARQMGTIRGNLALVEAFFKKWGHVMRWEAPMAGTIAFPRLLTGEQGGAGAGLGAGWLRRAYSSRASHASAEGRPSPAQPCPDIFCALEGLAWRGMHRVGGLLLLSTPVTAQLGLCTPTGAVHGAPRGSGAHQP
jgi:hypothetical protein